MATAIQKITLSSARDISFGTATPSQSNLRRVKACVSIEALARSIARRGLIQPLHARPGLDADGAETGMFEASGGDRRYRALERLAKHKRLTAYGPLHEIISWKLRMLAPTHADGQTVLKRVVARYRRQRTGECEAT